VSAPPDEVRHAGDDRVVEMGTPVP
jgi:hypothetical protein